MVLKRIGVLAAGKVLGLLYLVMGIFPGIMFALMAMAGAAAPQQPGAPENPFLLFAGLGVAAIIVMPIMYGIMGFIGGIICAAIYNVIASMAGGLELEFERPAGMAP